MPRRYRPASLASHNSSANDRPEPRLLRAVETNQIDAVKAVIEEAEAAAQGGVALLSVGLVRACDKNLIQCARFLLLQGADPDYVSGNKLPSIIRAAENGHAAIVKLLIAHNVDLLACDSKHQRTALMTAAWKDNIGIVSTLLATGVGIQATDRRQRNALHNIAAVNSAQQCSSEVVEALIAAGMKTEARDETGRTPLHWACAAGNVRIVKCLLKARVNLEALDSRMKTPLHLATWHDRLDLVHVLLDRGANIHAKSDGGWTALHYASSRASPPLVDLLVEAGSEVNGELLNGRTPLHAAAEFGNVETAACLLRRSHVKRAVKDRFGNTPLMIAAQHGKKDILEMLAPWNHLDLLSSDEKEACRRFEATIGLFSSYLRFSTFASGS
jgi:ankyrin repeat protein